MVGFMVNRCAPRFSHAIEPMVDHNFATDREIHRIRPCTTNQYWLRVAMQVEDLIPVADTALVLSLDHLISLQYVDMTIISL